MFPPSTKILVVDDMMTMRKLVTKICKDLGFSDILDAPDGAKAWEIVNNPSNSIQLIISDWNMPNATGLDLLKRVRADGRFKDLPFVMVTAEAEQHQIKEAIVAGVSSYIIKPFSPDSLKGKLEAVYQKMVA